MSLRIGQGGDTEARSFGTESGVSAELLFDRSVEAADLAVLKLTCPTPVQGDREWPFLHLDVHWRIRMQDVLRSFGFPQGRFDKSGIETSGQIVGRERISVNGRTSLPLRLNEFAILITARE